MSTRNSHYDVVIAGARPAGAATAMLLARQGARVLLLDRSRYGTDTLSTHALMRGGVLQLHRWGLLPHVIAAGTPAVLSATFYLPGAASTVEIKPRHGVEGLYAPRRTVLDAILVDAARSAGADVRFGTSVTGLLRDRSGRVTGITGRAGAARLEVGAGEPRTSHPRRAASSTGTSVTTQPMVTTGTSHQGQPPGSFPPTAGWPACSPPPVRKACAANSTAAPRPACGGSWPGRRPNWRTGSITRSRPARHACSPA